MVAATKPNKSQSTTAKKRWKTIFKKKESLWPRLQRSERFNVFQSSWVAKRTVITENVSLVGISVFCNTHERHCKSLKTSFLETSVHGGDAENMSIWFIGNDKSPMCFFGSYWTWFSFTDAERAGRQEEGKERQGEKIKRVHMYSRHVCDIFCRYWNCSETPAWCLYRPHAVFFGTCRGKDSSAAALTCWHGRQNQKQRRDATLRRCSVHRFWTHRASLLHVSFLTFLYFF